jgi:fatty-acyl-CoA synthase
VEARHFRFWPDDVPRTIDVPDQSLYENLESSAACVPDKAAIIYYGKPLSYSELKRQVDLLAGFLQQRCNVRKGDRVLLDMQNSPQFVIGFYAILRADAMVVPVNPMNLTEELRHYVSDSDARTILTAQELYPIFRPLLDGNELDQAIVACYGDYAGSVETDAALTGPGNSDTDETGSAKTGIATNFRIPEVVAMPRQTIEDKGITLWHNAIDARLAPDPHTASGDDKCVMPYTSGTTGRPKGCIHTHRTVMSTILAGALWVRSSDNPVVLGTLPLFHVTGMQGSMNGPIYRGATVVLMTRWDRDTAADFIQRYEVDSWTNIATMAIDFLANPDLDRYDVSSLRVIGGGGAAMPRAVAKRLHDLTGLSYIEGYGLSETIAPTHINPPQRAKRQCLGIPICSTDARVINPDTLEELPAGETGEIISSGPQIFLGYWKNPQATEAAFIEIDGKQFFRTGDLGYIDEDGYFFMVDRLKRMINASGFKVWPAEVESMLYAHPDIHETCVIGTRDAHRGETVKAIVVLKDGSKDHTDTDDIVSWAREHMAAYKVPRVVEFADSLPKSGTGKIQWRLLQERENSNDASTVTAQRK